MTPPRLVWKRPPSGVVPYLLTWVEQRHEDGRNEDGPGLVDGAVLQVPPCRAVPWSVQAVPAWKAEAASTIRPHPPAAQPRARPAGAPHPQIRHRRRPRLPAHPGPPAHPPNPALADAKWRTVTACAVTSLASGQATHAELASWIRPLADRGPAPCHLRRRRLPGPHRQQAPAMATLRIL